MQFSKKTRTSGKLRSVLTLVCGLVMMSGLSGCLVAGYSSRGGGFLLAGRPRTRCDDFAGAVPDAATVVRVLRTYSGRA